MSYSPGHFQGLKPSSANTLEEGDIVLLPEGSFDHAGLAHIGRPVNPGQGKFVLAFVASVSRRANRTNDVASFTVHQILPFHFNLRDKTLHRFERPELANMPRNERGYIVTREKRLLGTDHAMLGTQTDATIYRAGDIRRAPDFHTLMIRLKMDPLLETNSAPQPQNEPAAGDDTALPAGPRAPKGPVRPVERHTRKFGSQGAKPGSLFDLSLNDAVEILGFDKKLARNLQKPAQGLKPIKYLREAWDLATRPEDLALYFGGKANDITLDQALRAGYLEDEVPAEVLKRPVAGKGEKIVTSLTEAYNVVTARGRGARLSKFENMDTTTNRAYVRDTIMDAYEAFQEAQAKAPRAVSSFASVAEASKHIKEVWSVFMGDLAAGIADNKYKTALIRIQQAGGPKPPAV